MSAGGLGRPAAPDGQGEHAPMRFLLIAPVSGRDQSTPSWQAAAERLQSASHDVAVLVPVEEDGRRPFSMPVGSIPTPPHGGIHRFALPAHRRRRTGAFDEAISARAEEVLQRGIGPLPDLMVVMAADTSAVVARHLSVLTGIPFVILIDGAHGLQMTASGREAELIEYSALQASVALAPDAHLAQQARHRFAALRVEALDGGDEDPDARLFRLCREVATAATKPWMVFHAPYPLEASPSSASRQRPNKMLEAFSAIGFRVLRLSGFPFQRRVGFDDLRRRAARGQRIEFVYSENSTQPNALATSIRRGFAPLLEARIFGFCRSRGIPVGQFYRDVYWRFPEKQASVPLLRRIAMQVGYRVDRAVLMRLGAHIFLPSMPMAAIVPFPVARCTALPPGAEVRQSSTPRDGLELLYVGGVGPGHEVDEALRALRDVPGVSLTMVVPQPAWEAHRERYRPLLTERVEVLHASADQLAELYDRAAVCLLLVRPNQYRRFAVPMKLYEYIGSGKPTLASRGTLAGDLVEEMGAGFTVTDSAADIRQLLCHLVDHPELVEQAAARVLDIRSQETWAARARDVAAVLTGEQPV